LFREAPTQRTPPSLKLLFPQAFLDNEDNTEDYVSRVEMFIQIHAAKYTLNSKQTYVATQQTRPPQGTDYDGSEGFEVFERFCDKGGD
jgi:hypothetical protein